MVDSTTLLEYDTVLLYDGGSEPGWLDVWMSECLDGLEPGGGCHTHGAME